MLIIKRERFPRFHVGESLIPYGNDELRAIGFWEKLTQNGFMPKLGAELVMGDLTASIRILFGRYLAPGYAQTFQVERSRFDHLLLDHAAEAGCEVWQEAPVKSASVSDDGVKVACSRAGQIHEIAAHWILDASGRDAFLGKAVNTFTADGCYFSPLKSLLAGSPTTFGR